MRKKTIKTVPLGGVAKSSDGEYFATLYDASELDRDGESVGVASVTARESISLQIDHDHSVLRTIGVVTNIRAHGKRLRGRLQFAPEGVSEVADQVRRQVAAGVTGSVSIGFMAEPVKAKEGHIIWRNAELLELSFVSVPSSRGARVDRKALSRWLGSRGSSRLDHVDGDEIIEVVDDGDYIEIIDDEAGDVIEVDELDLAQVVAAATLRGLCEEIEDGVGRALDYRRGRV